MFTKYKHTKLLSSAHHMHTVKTPLFLNNKTKYFENAKKISFVAVTVPVP